MWKKMISFLAFGGFDWRGYYHGGIGWDAIDVYFFFPFFLIFNFYFYFLFFNDFYRWWMWGGDV